MMAELPGEQLRGLAMFCRRDRISRAAAVRRAVGIRLEQVKSANDGRVAAFGLWKGRRLNARCRVEQVRDEWQ